jgi:hypothetical protein
MYRRPEDIRTVCAVQGGAEAAGLLKETYPGGAGPAAPCQAAAY